MASKLPMSSSVVPTIGNSFSKHAKVTYELWCELEKLIHTTDVKINGHQLDIPTVIGVAKHGCLPCLGLKVEMLDEMNASVALLQEYLSNGYYVYGVNTGFGGSADSRTTDLPALQRALMQHTQSGVLIDLDTIDTASVNDDLTHHSMPSTWVKATMLVRCNATIRGHSAVNASVVESILQLLRHDLTPVVPLRGSVSASGDLMPLSYIAGAIQGSPDIWIRAGCGSSRKLITAREALRESGMAPIVLGPKEGLGLINGTAASAAVASLALYETHQLAILAQVLTATATEALAGNVESYHPFIAQVRPHEGQIEAACNIRAFLSGSRLARGANQAQKDRFKSGLYQDRYALRSSTQWMGPQLEDLLLAHKQITTELNSTADNPLVDTAARDIYSGANFQATSVTSAMEKTRLSLQMIGKMIFGQCSEMINPVLSNGLPSNLASDDPSLSFTMKGVDVNMAAYMSELAYLANPVSSHVQSAEMHNQPINSLALVSCRYTMQAVELVSLMSAGSLYVACQALDLRVMSLKFLQSLTPMLEAITRNTFGHAVEADHIDAVNTKLGLRIAEVWSSPEANCMDAKDRCTKAIDSCVPIIANWLSDSNDQNCSAGLSQSVANIPSITAIAVWKARMFAQTMATYDSNRLQFCDKQPTPEYLGQAAKRLYLFVRKTLEVPFHQGLVEHPDPTVDGEGGSELNGRPKRTIGFWVSTIYKSIRDGRLHEEAMHCLEEAEVV